MRSDVAALWQHAAEGRDTGALNRSATPPELLKPASDAVRTLSGFSARYPQMPTCATGVPRETPPKYAVSGLHSFTDGADIPRFYPGGTSPENMATWTRPPASG